MDAPRFDFAVEPEPTERHLPCPECRRNTLDRYADGVSLCNGPGCTYYHDDAPVVESAKKPAAILAGPSHLVTVAELREQLVPPLEEGLQIESMDDVKARPVSWLWKGLIPRGMLTLVVGDPGLGKSQMTLDFAARVSKGSAWPDGKPGDEPRNVLVLSAEDVADMVLKPRLLALGADVSRIKRIKSVVTKERVERHLSLETDVKYLGIALKKYNPSLILIDPLNAYMGKSETFKDNHVRSVLAPVCALAEQYGVAIVAVMHLNKDSSKKALYRAMGSVAFPAAARSSLMVSDDPESKRVLMTHSKSNLSKKSDGLAYVVEDVALADGIETSRIVWQAGAVVMTSDEAQNLSQPQNNTKGRRRDAVAEWLETLLADGPRPASEVGQLSKAAGHTATILRRAKQDLGVSPAFVDGRWMLSLAADF